MAPDRLRYHVLDVFAQTPFAGNPLAVVLDADHLDPTQMQRLARQFNLSETAFPLRPTEEERQRGADYRLRIFTPVVELPFAGHPSVGTAWLMARLGRVAPGRVVQACGAGELPLQVAPAGGRVELTGGAPTCSDPRDPGPSLAAVGLSPEDLADAVGRPVRVCGTGLPYQVVEVRPDALQRCSPDVRLLEEMASGDEPSGVYVTSWDAQASTVRARMFAGDIGTPEDPATGSAALAYGVWLAASGLVPADGEHAFTVHQGVEMGRPSLLSCRVDVVGGVARQVCVAGGVEPIAEGEIAVPGPTLPA